MNLRMVIEKPYQFAGQNNQTDQGLYYLSTPNIVTLELSYSYFSVCWGLNAVIEFSDLTNGAELNRAIGPGCLIRIVYDEKVVYAGVIDAVTKSIKKGVFQCNITARSMTSLLVDTFFPPVNTTTFRKSAEDMITYLCEMASLHLDNDSVDFDITNTSNLSVKPEFDLTDKATFSYTLEPGQTIWKVLTDIADKRDLDIFSAIDDISLGDTIILHVRDNYYLYNEDVTYTITDVMDIDFFESYVGRFTYYKLTTRLVPNYKTYNIPFESVEITDALCDSSKLYYGRATSMVEGEARKQAIKMREDIKQTSIQTKVRVSGWMTPIGTIFEPRHKVVISPRVMTKNKITDFVKNIATYGPPTQSQIEWMIVEVLLIYNHDEGFVSDVTLCPPRTNSTTGI